MRIREILAIKPIKPMAPGEARLAAIQRGIKQGRDNLKREKDAQRMKRDREAKSKAQQKRS